MRGELTNELTEGRKLLILDPPSEVRFVTFYRQVRNSPAASQKGGYDTKRPLDRHTPEHGRFINIALNTTLVKKVKKKICGCLDRFNCIAEYKNLPIRISSQA